jgi:hypothetical protein
MTSLATCSLEERKSRPEAFRILVATLAGDDSSGTLTRAVVVAFQGQHAIDVVPTCRVLKIQGAGLAAEEAAAKVGWEWLARSKADVLVFGEVLSKGEVLNLQFLTSGSLHDFTAKPFRFESGLLKSEFKEAAAAQLQAVALGAVKDAANDAYALREKTVANAASLARSPHANDLR